MGVLSLAKVRELVGATTPPCISIFIPTHRGLAARQDPIRLKNALGKAEERLLGSGQRRAEVEELLRPGRELIDRPELWRRQGDGLALYLSPTVFEPLRVGLALRELVVVGARFHLKPLLPLLTGDGRFYVLSLSQNRVRMLEATRDSSRELEVPGMPTSLEEGVNLDVKQHYFQSSHSTSEKNELFDAMVEPFLQRVDSSLVKLLADQRSPLVVAGVKRLRTAYRKLSKQPLVLEEGIDGNPEELDQQLLHEKAWEIVQPVFHAERQEAAARYLDLLGTERSEHELAPVLQAAEQGRVETLFVPVDENIWGHYHQSVEIVDDPDGEDLLDRAAVEVLLRRGTVFAVPRIEMPGQGAVNAVYRY